MLGWRVQRCLYAETSLNHKCAVRFSTPIMIGKPVQISSNLYKPNHILIQRSGVCCQLLQAARDCVHRGEIHPSG